MFWWSLSCVDKGDIIDRKTRKTTGDRHTTHSRKIAKNVRFAHRIPSKKEDKTGIQLLLSHYNTPTLTTFEAIS